jgi:hypothetical protein
VRVNEFTGGETILMSSDQDDPGRKPMDPRHGSKGSLQHSVDDGDKDKNNNNHIIVNGAYQTVPETVYRRVPLGPWATEPGNGQPQYLGAFTTGVNGKFVEVYHGEGVMNRDDNFECRRVGLSGMSTYTTHPYSADERQILELTNPACYERRVKERKKQEKEEAEVTEGREPVEWLSVGSNDKSVLTDMKEADVYGGIKQNDTAGRWKAHGGKGGAKYAFCYELSEGAVLPGDLRIVYDNVPPGHATIMFGEEKGNLRYAIRNGRAMGIHDELMKHTGWKLHCFLIAAKAEVNETVYPDPGVLQLLQYVDKYMDVCDEEDFSSLMHALKKTQIVDEKEKTLEAIFVHSSHAPLFLRAINNIKDSLPEDEQDIVNELLRLVEV